MTGEQRQALRAIDDLMRDARNRLMVIAEGQPHRPRTAILKSYNALCKAIDAAGDALLHPLGDEVTK